MGHWDFSYEFNSGCSHFLILRWRSIFGGSFCWGGGGPVSLMAIRVPLAKRSGSSFRQKEKCVFRVFIFASFFQFCFVVSVCK